MLTMTGRRISSRCTPTSRTPSKASERSDAHHHDDERHACDPRRRSAVHHRTLYVEVTAKRELERSFEDMVREIQP